MITTQGFVAYDLTGNSRAVGWVQFGQGIAMLLINPIGGAIADRLSKRFLLIFTAFALSATTFGVAALTFTDQLNVFFLSVAAFAGGTLFAVLVPARTAFMADAVGTALRGNAIALNQVGNNAARIVGPFLAAALLSWHALGYGGIFVVVGCSYLFIAIASFRLPPTTANPRRNRTGVLADMRSGVRYVAASPRLSPLLVCFIAVIALAQPYNTLLPAFATDVLDAGPGGYGIAFGVAAAGGLFVSIIVASASDSPRADLLLFGSTFAFGVSLFIMGFVPSFALLLPAIALVGGFSSGFQVLNNSITMRESDLGYLGRIQSLMMIAFSLTGIMSLPMGALADQLGERTVLHLMGIEVILVGFVMVTWLSAAKRRRQSTA
jgi:MFS family permease